jgi:hypothetical protein
MYKAAAYKKGKIYHWTSPDGNTFISHPASQKGFFQDASLLSMNPFRRKWLYFVKANYMTQVRTQLYSEIDIQDFGNFTMGPGYCPLSGKWFGEEFKKNPYSIWKGLGCLVEPPSDTYQPNRFQSPVFNCADSADTDFENDYLDSYCARNFYIPKRLTDIYFSVAFAYESIMVLLMPIHSKWNSKAPKIHYPHLGWSRDGFHYSRVPPIEGHTKRPKHGYIDVSSIPSNLTKKGTFLEWKPIGNSFLVKDDSLYAYLTHYGHSKTYDETWDRKRSTRHYDFLENYVSIFKFRRDGFVHLETSSQKQLLVTEILTVKTAKYLFINANASFGNVRVQIVRPNGSIFKPWSNAFTFDKTRHLVQWPKFVGNTVELLQKKKFVLVFELSRCALYSFWFSRSKSGASGGFVQSYEENQFRHD